jgi:hypothetical protein
MLGLNAQLERELALEPSIRNRGGTTAQNLMNLKRKSFMDNPHPSRSHSLTTFTPVA